MPAEPDPAMRTSVFGMSMVLGWAFVECELKKSPHCNEYGRQRRSKTMQGMLECIETKDTIEAVY